MNIKYSETSNSDGTSTLKSTNNILHEKHQDLGRTYWLDILVLIFATIAMLSFAWVGYLDSDDKNHLGGAFGWFYDAPYQALNHAELRHFIAIPIALSFKAFGVNEFAVVIPNILSFILLIILTYTFASRYFDRFTAILSVFLIITLPIFAIRATVAYSDIVELLFIGISFWLFVSVTENGPNITKLILCGAAAGAAWLTRETTISLIILYAVLFIMGYGIARRQYWIIAAGFLLVIAVDAIYFAWQTGDPLFRYWMVLDTQSSIVTRGYGGDAELFDRAGNIRVFPGLDRLLVLLLNHEFSILYFFFFPAAWWAWKGKGLSASEKNLSRLLIGLAILWFIFVATMLKNQHPRYYSVTTYCAAILCSLWIYRYLFVRYKIYGVFAVVLLVSANILAIYVDNKNSLFGERTLVAYVKNSNSKIYTDPMTHRRARMLLKYENMTEFVISDQTPPINALYFYNPNRVNGTSVRIGDANVRLTSWELVTQINSERKFFGQALELFGLQELVPSEIYRRLNKPNKDVAIYRVTNGESR